MIKCYKIAEKVALEVELLTNTQLGPYNNYIVGIDVLSTKNSKHAIPRTYNKDSYVCVEGANMKPPEELELPEYLEGILIYHEQNGRLQ